MTNPRLGCESHPEILEGNHAKGKSGLKELLVHLTDTVSRIAQEVDAVRQENVDLKRELFRFKGTEKSWNLFPQLCNEIAIEQPASNKVFFNGLQAEPANAKCTKATTKTRDDPTQTSASQEVVDDNVNQNASVLNISASSTLPVLGANSSGSPTPPSVEGQSDIVTRRASSKSMRKGTLSSLQNFMMKRAWHYHPELLDVTFQPSSANSGDVLVKFESFYYDVEDDSTWLNVIVMDPGSIKRCLWILASLYLLMYDLVFVPVDIAFDVEEALFTKAMERIALIFWTLDIPANFLTAVPTPHGLDRRLTHIAGQYVRTWFFFDLLLVMAEFASLILGSYLAMATLLRVARWGRLSRLLRLVRIVRVAKLHSLIRPIAVRFRLSKSYVELTHGLIGQTILFIVSAHMLACIWHYFSRLIDHSWVQANHLESASVGQLYVVSIHWTYSRLCLTMSRHHIQSTPELLLDACLMFVSFILTAGYFGMVTSIAITKANSHPLNLWRASVAFSARYRLSKTLKIRLEKVLEATHYLGAAEVSAEEDMFLRSIPASLKKDLIFESRVQLLMKKQLFTDMVGYNKQVVVAVCNKAMSPHVIVSTEVLFEIGDAGNEMRFIFSGAFSYQSKYGTCSLLQRGSVVSEMVLWTDTEHLGQLLADEESRVLTLDAVEFIEALAEHKEAHMHAARYAKHFVWHLNEQPQSDDLTEFAGLDLEAINTELFEGTSMDHFVFISHYKIESGTEATLLRDLMDSALRESQSHHANFLRAPIFIDSEDLVDLARLKEHVLNSDILMVLLTPGIFSRPWCLLEMVTAIRHSTILVPVEVQRPGSQYQYPNEEFYRSLLDGKYLSEDSVSLLASEGVSLQEIESTIRQLFRKISLPFSPHKTKVIREAEVSNILKRCESELSQHEDSKRYESEPARQEDAWNLEEMRI